jgi:hypothetical protein
VKAIHYLDIEQSKYVSFPSRTKHNLEYKRCRLTREEGAQREAKHMKESEYWLHQSPTSNLYTALLEEDNGQQQQKPSPIYVSDIVTISLLIQLLEQIVTKI